MSPGDKGGKRNKEEGGAALSHVLWLLHQIAPKSGNSKISPSEILLSVRDTCTPYNRALAEASFGADLGVLPKGL